MPDQLKYLVISIEKMEADHGPDVDEQELETLDRVDVEIRKVAPCKDLEEVSMAIKACEATYEYEWSVFEMEKGKFVRKAVMFEKDGRSIKALV